ncbi:MAG: AAA family ATPase [Phycisphaerales bacterium]|nr:AAA family ATPase [Phycisphaerales bacterium]
MAVDEPTECEDGRIIRKVEMTNEHITRLEVSNFKMFDRLVVENIGQVNLITGDNNVGKTSLLECFLMVNNDIDQSVKNLHRTLCTKNIHIHPKRINLKEPIFPDDNYFNYIKKDKDTPIKFGWEFGGNAHSISFQDCLIDSLTERDFEKRTPEKYGIGNPNLWIKVFKDESFKELQWMYLDDFKRGREHSYWPLITINAGFQEDVNDYYSANIGIEENQVSGSKKVLRGIQVSLFENNFKELNYEEKKRFISSLLLFIPDIEDTAIKNYFGRDILSIKSKSFENYQPITFWGEGFNKFVRCLLEIIKCKNSFLLIDEIDTGIHWTKMKEFWIKIIESSQFNNVQLICSTHSQDCIKAFVQAGEEMSNMKSKLRLIELEEFDRKGQIKHTATTYDYESLKYKLDVGTNVRGGDVWQ